jgi:hypothetical protein
MKRYSSAIHIHRIATHNQLWQGCDQQRAGCTPVPVCGPKQNDPVVTPVLTRCFLGILSNTPLLASAFMPRSPFLRIAPPRSVGVAVLQQQQPSVDEAPTKRVTNSEGFVVNDNKTEYTKDDRVRRVLFRTPFGIWPFGVFIFLLA